MKDIMRVIGCGPVEWAYEMMHEKFDAGLISEDEWKAYCDAVLEDLMAEHQEILDRLKNV